MTPILGKLEHTIDREILVRAPRATVFRFFTDSTRWAQWWGKGSSIDARPGGALLIVYPDGSRASGEVLEVRALERFVFTYGYEGAGKPIAPGGSRVTIRLAEHPEGTRLSFLHELADRPTRDHHVQGWRYHLAVFANVAANEAHAAAAVRADAWFAAWNEADAAARERAFAALVHEDIVFQDAHSSTHGLADLVAHVAGAKVFMAGITLARTSEPRHCQGTALVDWQAKKADGSPLAKGTNVLEFAPDGRITRVVGLWG
jgi:uncharacterized protein YndB with AHSA1/START domain